MAKAMRTLTRVTSALGIRVGSDVLDRWRASFAPQIQPFRTDRLGSEASLVGRRVKPTLDVRDTFHVYGGNWTWLDESEFVELSLKVRRTLLFRRVATGRLDQVPDHARSLANAQRTDSRVVWWPSLLRRVGDGPLLTYVENGLPPSRHREVTSAIWAGAGRVLPCAADLAGRLPSGSGLNCFGNVMAAAGVQGAESEQTLREPFEDWLAEHTTPVQGTRRDDQAGVVLVWRNREGLAEHAAVTIGDGYVLNKPSQAWFSPRVVWTVQETIAASRYRGVTLSRHFMAAQA
jgi:hypothetical protein